MSINNEKIIVGEKKGKPYVQHITSIVEKDFIKAFSERTNITIKDSRYILQSLNKMMYEYLMSGESVRFPGAGTINIRNTGKAEIYSPIVNDGKGGYVKKDNYYRFSFTPSRYLKEAIYFDEEKLIDQYDI